MPFSRSIASQRARTLSRSEFEKAIHDLCAAFDVEQFPGIACLEDVRQLVEVFSNEKQRRDVHDTIVQPTG